MEQRKEPLSLGACHGRKAEIQKTSSGYQLLGLLPDGKKITLSLQTRYLGVEVNEKLLEELCNEGRTHRLLFTQHGGQHDYGCLVLTAGGVTIELERHYLQGRCPVCGGRIIHTSKGYFCEHYGEEGEKECHFHALGILAHRAITEQEMEDFLAGHPEILDGFRKDNNEPFSGFLVLNKDQMLAVSSRICRCPNCGGMLYVRPTGFRCEHYYDADNPCRTFFYRNYKGVQIKRHMLEEIVKNGRTKDAYTFFRDDGRLYPGYLELNKPQTRIQIIEQV